MSLAGGCFGPLAGFDAGGVVGLERGFEIAVLDPGCNGEEFAGVPDAIIGSA
jgi:hypothetical protein